MNLRDSIKKLPFVGESRQEKYKKLGIETIEDLLRFQPRDFVDLRNPLKIEEVYHLPRGTKVAIWAKIEKLSFTRTPRRGVFVVKAKIADGTGSIESIWFNQRYLASFFKESDQYLFYGTLGFDFSNKKISLQSPKILPKPDIYITYPQTRGLSSRQISQSIKLALESGYQLEEYLPRYVLEKFDLVDIKQASNKMHFPQNEGDLITSRARFDFENIFKFICQNIIQNKQKNKKVAFKVDSDRSDLGRIIADLPFQLTEDQKQSIDEILSDFRLSHPMNRLLQGDVGSGKTIVSFIAAYFAIKAGFQVIYLAPTEILANQQFSSAEKFFEKFGFTLSLITGKSKNDNLEADLIVGTHAILNRDINFEKVALVIIDEQHRFGVEQRARLIDEGRAHLLSLSATPIPRTVGHLLFGNLSISQIKSKPSGRKKTKTFVVPERKRNDAFLFVDKLIEQGQQAFIICPLIEESGSADTLFEFDEVKSIKRQVEDLRETCLGLRKIESLNGKMKSQEKERVMADFRSGKTDILVSTSVVEVGIDVPNATVMMIEGADRFGLAQLHQFRGRVGRNELQSYCFLFTNSLDSEGVSKRLKAFVRTDDGFELSKTDLKLRGFGKMFGLEQSGFGEFNPAWLNDEDRLKKINAFAEKTIEEIDKYKTFKQKLSDEMAIAHLE